MKNKLFLLLGFVFLLSLSLASAAYNDAILYYSFDDSSVSSSTVNDLSSSSFDGTISGATTGATGILGESFSYDGTNDYVYKSDESNLDLTGSYSYSVWFYADDLITWGVNRRLVVKDDGADTNGGWGASVWSQTSTLVTHNPGGNTVTTVSSRNTSQWYHLVVTYNDSTKEKKIYLDNNVVSTKTEISNVAVENDYLCIGTYCDGSTDMGQYWRGLIDEVAIYDYNIGSDGVSALWNGGQGFNPYDQGNVTVNDSTESTAVVKQLGSVSFSGGAPTTIFSSSFNVSNDNTPLYGAYSFNVESNGVNTMFCELLINGSSQANVTRTQQTSVLGSVFIQTPVFIVNEGTYTQELQCTRQSGVGLITINNAIGVGHFLIDQDNNYLNYNTSAFDSVSVSSGTSYTLLNSFNVTIGNKTDTDLTQNRTHHLVVESTIEYNNLGGVTELLTAYMDINGTNCSFYPRTVNSGSSGSVSMDCILNNVTENATYQINVYGNGSNAEYSSNLVGKDLFLSSNEVGGGKGSIVGLNFSGNSFVGLGLPTDAGNLNHDIASSFSKLSMSILTDTDTTVQFYLNLTDGTEYITTTWERDFVAGETGVIIGHDVLQNIPKDEYTGLLYANCGTVDANCSIVGGQFNGYLTDVVTTVLNAFNVTVYDFFNNNNILNFNVVDGGTWTTTTGSVLVFTNNNPENLTIISNGYQNYNVLNHNTTLDLNVTLTPLYYFENVYYTGFTNYTGDLYTNNLTYYVEALCPLGETHNAYIVIDGTIFVTDQLICNNNLVNNTGNFVYSFEGEYNQYVNWTGNTNIRGNQNFIWDLFRPTISQSFTTGTGFNNNSIEINVLCYDSISPLLTYNSTFVTTPLTYSNQSNNTLLTFSDSVEQNNYVYTECTDLAGNLRTNNYSQTIYNSFFYLVNEQDGNLFNINNLTSAIVYLDDNTTSLDLKAGGTNNFTFTSAGEDILRFEYIYSDGFIINRYFSMDLTDSNETRICAIEDKGLQFYEQVIVSSIDSKQVSLEASFADCVVIRDRTRFAYQNAFSLRTYVIDTTYKLYNYVAGNVKSILASIDGGIEAFINVDSIEFSSSAFNQGIRAESLNIEKYSSTTMLIYYNNTNQDNTDLDIVITRQDTGAIVYADTELDDNNNLILFYDFSALTGLENNTLFKVVIDATRTDGSTNTLIRFFNTAGSVGQLNPKVAFAIIFTLLLFGLTFPAASDALSWFGMLLCIGNLGIFAFTVMTTGLKVLLAVDVIVLIYIGIILSTQTNRVVAT